MLKIKNLRGECQHCGGTIEFHAEHVGANAECPHCGQQTELLLAAPPEEASPVRKKAIVFTVCAILILGGGVIAIKVALNRAKQLKERQQQSSQVDVAKPAPVIDPFAGQNFRVSPVTVAKGADTAIVYAVGSIVNTANRQRFGVRVEIDLFDDTGSKVGVASDYQKVLEPNAEWRFRAMVMEKRTSTAKVAAIKEAQ